LFDADDHRFIEVNPVFEKQKGAAAWNRHRTDHSIVHREHRRRAPACHPAHGEGVLST
jgi:hypothetical protein